MSSPRWLSGTVKFFHASEPWESPSGFGFIVGSDGADYFFSESVLLRSKLESLQAGDTVRFRARIRDGKRQVRYVRIVLG